MGMTVLPDNVLRRLDPSVRKSLGKAGVTAQEAQDKLGEKLERDLQRQIASMLTLHGIEFCSPRMDRRTRIKKSWPDFTFAVNGMACAFEAKRPGEKATQDQSEMHDRMRKNGWRVVVVTSVEQVRNLLNQWVCDREKSE